MGAFYPPLDEQYRQWQQTVQGVAPLPGKTPGATRYWGSMAPLQNEQAGLNQWLNEFLTSLNDPTSALMGVGMAGAMPFQSRRRLPELPGVASPSLQKANQRQMRMEQKGSAFDSLVDDLHNRIAVWDEDEAEFLLGKLSKNPHRVAGRVAKEFELSPEDGLDVVKEFVRYLKTKAGGK